jgi:hypothetical protein
VVGVRLRALAFREIYRLGMLFSSGVAQHVSDIGVNRTNLCDYILRERLRRLIHLTATRSRSRFYPVLAVDTRFSCNPEEDFEERRNNESKLISSGDGRLPFR